LFPALECLKCYANAYPHPPDASLAAVKLYAPRLRRGPFVNYYTMPTGALTSLVTLATGLSGPVRQFDATAFFGPLHNVAQTLTSPKSRTSNRVSQGYESSAPNVQFLALAVLGLRSTIELLLFISAPNFRTLSLGGNAGGTTYQFEASKA
jgi:hypothetical protein